MPCPDLAPAPPHPWRWISAAQLARDAVRLAGLLPPDCSGIVGVPRSGMIPAAVIATHLHLPLYELGVVGPRQTAAGSRGGTLYRAPGPLAVVEDTCYSGASMTRARAAMRGRPAVFAAVYARPEARSSVDLCADELSAPHLLEWNWASNGPLAGYSADPIFLGGMACDFDGVLCEDPSLPDADSGPGLEVYRRWLAAARPRSLPRMYPVPAIVTARIERWRPETEAWLGRWGVKCRKLVMHPAKRASEREAAYPVAKFKADAYRESGCGFFIESDGRLAADIFRLTGRPVIHPGSETVFH